MDLLNWVRLNWLLRLLPVFIIFLLPLTGITHPHVFISQRTCFVFDDKGLAGFRVNWAFDEMFSVMISEDFDSDQNQVLVVLCQLIRFSLAEPFSLGAH